MRSLLRFLIRNYAFLLFLFLEVVSLVLVFNYNSFQKSKFLNSSNYVSAGLYGTVNSVFQYFDLAKVNRQLAEENAALRTQLQMSISNSEFVPDTLGHGIVGSDTTFRFTPARVINNSVNKQQNYITLNKGRKDGIKPDQGILSPQGIVGVITSVSESYSTGLSLLNPRWNVSAKLKKSGFYGSLAWNGEDYQLAELLEIPFHVKLAVGDTIVTSGHSSIFPEGLLIGVVDEYEQPEGENYYDIKVRLATDFKSIRYVEVIDNVKKEELEKLEKNRIDGESTN
ncbi:rod shape-determining protein MreC [Prolixibacteraceae bacterium Z1-6]|uniref:Cell shape-determining protein MreC n=1 Tax=Draconibacterium aestuarii TaxID=2998507 RepID=A0A9X3F8P3_9BACT|nr:rod shape-determining protein MreC [Prolixibacteraceae bacterium Z1-6]